jgi:type III pantothenate kinase
MRIITIDNGNTNPHAGIFENDQLIAVQPLASFEQLPDDFILMSNVGKRITFTPNIDLKQFRTPEKFFYMPVNYGLTLGEDRLYSAFYLYQSVKKTERVLLLDAGTFLTADLITEQGFIGGYIFPGSRTFLKSYTSGHQLPHIQSLQITEDLPASTEEAISMAHEMYWESILENLVKKISPSRIVLTGGDGQMLEKKYKKLNLTFPLEFDPHLLHRSMHSIYLHHLKDRQ